LVQAQKWINENEHQPRGWYAGPVGWFNLDGEGDFAVAIRSALLSEDACLLYAGSGIVDGSVAKLEYEETTVKLEAMLAAIGVI